MEDARQMERTGGRSGMRYIVLVSLVAALALLGAGCGGGDESGEESGGKTDGQYSGQYSGGERTAVTNAEFSEEACLEEAAESGEADLEISEPGDAPTYEISAETETETGKEFEVVTEARSSDELEKVAEAIRYENRDLDSFSVDFLNEAEGDPQDAGLALVFNTREAACRAFEYPVEEQDEIISENNGITVVSVEEGV